VHQPKGQPKGYKPSGSPHQPEALQTKWLTSHMSSQVPPVNAYKAIEASGQEPMAKLQSPVLPARAGWLGRPKLHQAKSCATQITVVEPCSMRGIFINPHLLRGQSMAFALASEPTTKQKQFEKNYQPVEASQGMLAPYQGTERYRSVASSHFVAWCRAVQASCKSSDGEVLSASQQMTHSGSFAKKAGSGQFLMPAWNSNSQAFR